MTNWKETRVCIQQKGRGAPEEGGVNDVGAISRRDQEHARAAVRAVHLRQQLVHHPARQAARSAPRTCLLGEMISSKLLLISMDSTCQEVAHRSEAWEVSEPRRGRERVQLVEEEHARLGAPRSARKQLPHRALALAHILVQQLRALPARLHAQVVLACLARASDGLPSLCLL